tara:strand:+ start:104 stop:3436 length:3333 start_codon:yes stop_codon:yes gene_type:complete
LTQNFNNAFEIFGELPDNATQAQINEAFGVGPEVDDEPPELGVTPGGISLRKQTLKDIDDPEVEKINEGTLISAAESMLRSDQEKLMTSANEELLPTSLREKTEAKNQTIEIKPELVLDKASQTDVAKAALLEYERVDNVIKEKVGDRYAGYKSSGDLDFNLARNLSYRDKFEDRKDYFLKRFPEGEYFRVPTGGGQLKELYSYSKKGKVYMRNAPVFNPNDPTKRRGALIGNVVIPSMSEILGDLTGKVGRFQTVGAIVGALVPKHPFLTTFATAGLGQALDQYMQDESGKPSLEIVGDINKGKAATYGLLDAAFNKFLLGTPIQVQKRLSGQADSLLVNKADQMSLDIVQSYKRLSEKFGLDANDLPAISIAQVLNPKNNPLIQRTASQVSGTSPRFQILMNKQQKALHNLLQRKLAQGAPVGRGSSLVTEERLANLTQNELIAYLDLSQRKLAQELAELGRVKLGATSTLDVASLAQSTVKGAKELEQALQYAVNHKYTQAFNSAGAEKVVFDISSLGDIIKNIRAGTRIRTKGKRPKGDAEIITTQPGGRVPTARVEGEVSGELKALLDSIDSYSTRIKSINVNKPDSAGNTIKESVDSLSQLKGIKDKINRYLIESEGKERATLMPLIDEIDEIMKQPLNNPNLVGTEWHKFYSQATNLAEFQNNIINTSKLTSLFSKKGDIDPISVAEKFYNGTFRSNDLKLLERLILETRGASQTGVVSAREQGNKFLSDLRQGFLAHLTYDPSQIGSKIKTLKEADIEVYNRLVPQSIRKELENIQLRHTWLQNDAVKKAIDVRLSESERAMTLINDLGEQDFAKLVAENGGVDSQFAKGLRHAVLQKIIDNSKKLDPTSSSQFDEIDVLKLSREFKDLKNFSSSDSSIMDYSKLKPLFYNFKEAPDARQVLIPRLTENMKTYLDDISDISNYALGMGNINPGGDLVSQSGVGAIQDLQAKGIVKLYRSDLIARWLSQPASTKQVKQLFDGKFMSDAKKVRLFSNMLGMYIRSFNLDIPFVDRKYGFEETPIDEIKRTGDLPKLGDAPEREEPVNTSNLTTDDKPPINVSSLLPPVNQRNTQANSAKFASLFPRDNLGQAIADRSGIMGAVG